MLGIIIKGKHFIGFEANYLQISKVIQMLVRFHRVEPNHPAFKQHQERVQDYLWLVSQDDFRNEYNQC